MLIQLPDWSLVVVYRGTGHFCIWFPHADETRTTGLKKKSVYQVVTV